jgi:hypothetical protein
MDIQTNEQTIRQTNRQTDTQIERQTHRKTDIHIDRKFEMCVYNLSVFYN